MRRCLSYLGPGAYLDTTRCSREILRLHFRWRSPASEITIGAHTGEVQQFLDPLKQVGITLISDETVALSPLSPEEFSVYEYCISVCKIFSRTCVMQLKHHKYYFKLRVAQALRSDPGHLGSGRESPRRSSLHAGASEPVYGRVNCQIMTGSA